MNMLTFNDVNRDVKAILDGVSDTNRPVPSTMRAAKIAFVVPLLGIMLSTLTFGVAGAHSNHVDFSVNLLIGYLLSGDAIPVYMSVFVGLIQGLMLLPYVTLYHSIPQDVRDNTPLIAIFKKALFKGFVFYALALTLTCVMSFKNEIYLFSTPIVMVIAIFATSITINLQVTKYGVGAFINKLMKVIN